VAEKEKTEKNTEKLNRDKALDLALSQIEKQHGKGSIMRLGDERAYIPVEVISTGALTLDVALGVGGLPRGRVTEIYGPEASGKTTLSLHVIANAQKLGGKAAFIDVEHALDPKYAKILGVNLDDLLVSQPDTGEQALDITEVLIRSNAMDVIVIDSVAALVPRAELEGDMGDSHMGLQARLMSQALRKLTSSISKSKTICIFINQIRMKIGVMWGSPETTTGGKALKFYASIRLDIRRTGNITGENETIIGSTNRVKVVKNKVAPPFRQATFDVFYNQGISWEGSVVDAAAEHGILEKAGSWYSYNGVKIGQGREAAKTYLKENPDISKEIETKVKEKAGVIQPASKGKGDK
jgi:recombination protein RecA